MLNDNEFEFFKKRKYRVLNFISLIIPNNKEDF